MKKDDEKNRYYSFDDVPLFLDASDIAKLLGLSRSNVYEMLRSESFPVITIGNRRIVYKEKLFAWIDSHEACKKPISHNIGVF